MLNSEALNEPCQEHLGRNAEHAKAQSTQRIFLKILCVLCAFAIFAHFSRGNLQSGYKLIGEESVIENLRLK